MVTVALGMADADQCAKREVLLHREASLAGQVLACDEEFLSPRAPLGRACRIDERFVDPFAGFGRDAVIAERTGEWKRIVGIVGLVDNEVTAGKRAERRLPRNVSRHRLLYVEQSCPDRPQSAVMVKPIDQRAQGYEVRI